MARVEGGEKPSSYHFKVNISVEIKNVGKYEGDEVVQLYIRDVISSIARPVKELKGFKRINLKPGEKKTIDFVLSTEELSLLNNNMKPVVEPGSFQIMIENLTGEFEVRDR